MIIIIRSVCVYAYIQYIYIYIYVYTYISLYTSIYEVPVCRIAARRLRRPIILYYSIV